MVFTTTAARLTIQIQRYIFSLTYQLALTSLLLQPVSSMSFKISPATTDDSLISSSPIATPPAFQSNSVISIPSPPLVPTSSPLPSSSPPSSSPVDIFSSSPLPSSQSSNIDIKPDKRDVVSPLLVHVRRITNLFVERIRQHDEVIDATLALRQLKEEESLLPSSSPYEIYISETSQVHSDVQTGVVYTSYVLHELSGPLSDLTGKPEKRCDLW
jgi:hypothetical protein